MVQNEPALFICYCEEGDSKKLGPFYTAVPDGCSVGEWQAYIVQTINLKFERITVPWNHSLRGIVKRELAT